MKIKITTVSLLVFLMSFSACGYKSTNLLKQKSYFVQQIKLSGDKRIGYLIKNEILLNSSSAAERTIDINLLINKKKEIKDKNISGKITSYKLVLDVDLTVINVKNSKKIEKKFMKSNSYSVANNHSDTLSNEKRTLENLAETITEDIINFLSIYLKN